MKKVVIGIIIIVIISGLVLAGCSRMEKPVMGGILKISDPMPVYSQFGDPLNISGKANFPASFSLERLIEPGDKVSTYKYVLAEKIILAPDKSYYDIKLRQNVKFHDGTDFDAAAVKWNMDRVKAAHRTELAKVSSIQVMDKYTVRLNLAEWDMTILNELFHDDLFMISPNSFETNGGTDWADTHPIGTGPFIFKEIRNHQYLVWARNPAYWQPGLPRLDGVELHSISDPATFTAALKAGDVLGTRVSDFQTASGLKQDPDYNVYVSCPWFTLGVSMNTVDPSSVWSDVRMRQAFAHAIDEKTTCDALGNGLIQPRYAIITGIESSGYKNANPYVLNIEKSKALMVAAGHPAVSFKLYVSTGQWTGSDQDYILAWQQQLGKVDLNMEIVPMEQAKYDEMSRQPLPGNDMVTTVLQGNGVSLLDPIIISLQEGTGFAIGDARPAEWQDLLTKALVEKDDGKQFSLIGRMETAAYEQLLPYIPLQSCGWISVMSKKVHDYTFGLGGAYLAKAWLEP